MDPNQALQDWLEAETLEDQVEYMAALMGWLVRGGFEPKLFGEVDGLKDLFFQAWGLACEAEALRDEAVNLCGVDEDER